MSKAALFLAVPTVVAVVGLGAMNLNLQGEVAELRDQLADQEAAVVETVERVVEKSAPSGREGSRKAEQTARALEDRMVQLETRVTTIVERPAAPAAAMHDGEAPVELTGAYATTQFAQAVETVVDAREERRRQERAERAIQQRVDRMLRGLEVTDAQKGDILALTRDMGLRRDELRKDETLEREVRREQFTALTESYRQSLQGVLDAEQWSTLEPRLARSLDGGGGRRGGAGGRRGMDDGGRRGGGNR